MTRFAASLLICLLWAAPGWAAGLTYRLEPRLIAPDTYVFKGAVEHFTLKNGGNILNTGFIVTEAGVIVIQTGPSRRYGEEMRAAIAKVTERPILKVFVSNQHPDYFLGSQVFADVPIAALPGTIEGIRAEGRAVTENMYRLIGDWMRGTDMVVPVEPVFAATQVYGGHRLRLIPLSGHTQADLAVYDETTRVLFAGGLVFSDRAPTTPHADIPRWLSSLDELAALDVAVLVPNHGTIRPDNSAIAQTRDYLNWLTRTLAQSADSGLDMTEVMALEIPARFSALNVLREEFTRSVAHLYPKIEQSILPKIN
jgi:quinoprotein relay system zinc metallohydrolase 1